MASEKLDPEWLENLHTPDMQALELPGWLPEKAEEKYTCFYKILLRHKDDKVRMVMDMWQSNIEWVEATSPAFCDENLKYTWQSLNKKYPDVIEAFSYELIQLHQDFRHVVGLMAKHKLEVKSSEKVLRTAQNLINAMHEYENFYGHMIQDNHSELLEMIETFTESTKADLYAFRQSRNTDNYFCDLWPVSRETYAENAEAIFAARKLVLFFVERCGAPEYDFVADFVNALHQTEYDYNQIIKLSDKLKTIPKVITG